VSKHEFLSDGWFERLQELLTEHGADAPAHQNMVMNLVVTDTPWGDRELHMGAKDGKADMGMGLEDGADVTLTTDYGTAKDVFVSGNQQAGMQAFMSGKVKVQGDMTKLMAMQQGTPDPEAAAIAEKIKEMTA